MTSVTEGFRMRVREGNRGGQEQFRWESVKDQDFKDRECYLGQSTKVGMMGKFGRYVKHDWYASKRDTPDNIKDEMKTLKAYEAELFAEALGQKPKKLLLAKRQLTDEEMKLLFSKEDAMLQGRESLGSKYTLEDKKKEDAEQRGLGFAPHRTARLESIKAETLGVKGELEASGSAKDEPELVSVKYEPVAAHIKLEPPPTPNSPRIKQELPDEDRLAITEGKRPRLKAESGANTEMKREKNEKKKSRYKKDKKKKKKKLKKAEKKLRKAEKKLEKEERKRRRKGGHDVSSSSSSGSSRSSSSSS